MLFLRMAGNRILQLANYRLEFGCLRFRLRSIFAYFCSYLHVLNNFHYFVSCQTALAFCKCCPETCPKSLKNYAKIHQNSSQIHPKSTKVVPRSAPKATLRASRFHVFPPTKFLGPFWCHLGDVGRHLVPNWAPTGLQNRPLGHQVAFKSPKNAIRMSHQKKHEFLIEF